MPAPNSNTSVGWVSPPPDAPTTPTPPPAPAPATGAITSGTNLLAEARAAFPWIDQIGLTPEFFQNLIATSASSAEIITQLRAAPQYRQRFPGLWRQDGSIRMTEAQYLAREADFRTLLSQNGRAADYTTPGSLVGFFDSEMDPNELKDRLDVYRQLQSSGRATQDAFYVYAGLRVTTDDLYEATVDSARGDRLVNEYNSRVASSSFDYTTWITRATELGLERVSRTLTGLQSSGAVTGTAVQTVLRTDPTFARTIMDALYTGGQPGNNQLNLQELLSTFEYAAIGAAASNAGLSLPSRERIAEIRSAGVDRARAQQAYVQYGQQRGVYGAAVERTGGGEFDQDDFEDAALLGNAGAAGRLTAGLAREDAAGKGSGQFGVQLDRQGQLEQAGFRSPFA